MRQQRLLYIALFAGAALISGFTILRGLDPFDEGLMLQAARRVAEGQEPYRDFLWAYGPAQPLLLGGLFKAFGVSLVQWRVLRALTDAAVAVLVYAFVRREASPRLALAGWLCAACAMAEPRSANPFPLALLAALGAVYLATGGEVDRRRVLWAAGLTALAAAFRVDFGIYAAAGVLTALAWGRRWRDAGAYAGGAIALSLLLYLPFLVAIGPADLYQALIGTSLHDKDYWTLPFPLSYHGGLSGLRDVKDLLDFYVPVLLVAGLAASTVAGVLKLERTRRIGSVWPALGVLGACFFAYMLSRNDDFHAQPLIVLLAILLPMVVLLGPRWMTVLGAVLLGLLVLHGAWNRASALVRPPAMQTVDVAVAHGAQAPPAEAQAVEAMVPAVQRRVPPGDPIYVITRRSDLVRFNNPLVYVLTERDNPTRHDFGLDTGPAAQASIVATLERVQPRVIVRWTDPISTVREPNLRGTPTDVHVLDQYVAQNYRLAERHGVYDILVPR